MALESTLTYPGCGLVKTEHLPEDACQRFYKCENCHVLLKPKYGDCCVFCSDGSVKCPAMQITDADKTHQTCCNTNQ